MPNEKANSKKEKLLCVDNLRHAEYYGMQSVFDDLYARGKNGDEFTDLMTLILSRENILLAYRNIKTNAGSKTAGTDGLTMHISTACVEICEAFGLDSYAVTYAPLEMVETLQTAQQKPTQRDLLDKLTDHFSQEDAAAWESTPELALDQYPMEQLREKPKQPRKKTAHKRSAEQEL